MEYLKSTDEEWELLNSAVGGLYNEIDKLTKKAPADEISELAMKRVNQVIKRIKGL